MAGFHLKNRSHVSFYRQLPTSWLDILRHYLLEVGQASEVHQASKVRQASEVAQASKVHQTSKEYIILSYTTHNIWHSYMKDMPRNDIMTKQDHITLKPRVLSIMPKIPEISVGIQMERSVSVSSDRNIGITSGGGPLISVGIRRSIFDKPVLCPN